MLQSLRPCWRCTCSPVSPMKNKHSFANFLWCLISPHKLHYKVERRFGCSHLALFSLDKQLHKPGFLPLTLIQGSKEASYVLTAACYTCRIEDWGSSNASGSSHANSTHTPGLLGPNAGAPSPSAPAGSPRRHEAGGLLPEPHQTLWNGEPPPRISHKRPQHSTSAIPSACKGARHDPVR
jgi:hypothetical protein